MLDLVNSVDEVYQRNHRARRLAQVREAVERMESAWRVYMQTRDPEDKEFYLAAELALSALCDHDYQTLGGIWFIGGDIHSDLHEQCAKCGAEYHN
jgi:hypothetical protein